MQAAPVGASEPTPDERTTAMLAHVLTIFAGFIAPLIIYLAKRRDSRFVAFHAMQALLWHLWMLALYFVGAIGSSPSCLRRAFSNSRFRRLVLVQRPRLPHSSLDFLPCGS